MNKRWFRALGMMLCFSARGELTVDERQMLEQAFAETNTPREVFVNVYPTLSNCWLSLKVADPEHSRELQYSILTNACYFKTGDVRYWSLNGMMSRYRLFMMQCCFECGTNDLAYLEQCADFIGNEMAVVERRPDLHPRVVFNYNCEVLENRKPMLKRFRRLVERFEKTLNEEAIPGFRSNIIQRAKLTDKEKLIVFPPLQ